MQNPALYSLIWIGVILIDLRSVFDPALQASRQEVTRPDRADGASWRHRLDRAIDLY